MLTCPTLQKKEHVYSLVQKMICLYKIVGQVLFKQIFPNGTLEVKINLRGLPADDQQARAIHIHQYGDLSQGCVTAGAHYNPQAVDHPGHPGDLGNFVSEQGVIRKFMRLPEAKLFGGHSVLGRAVVVYEKEDDLGLGSDEESKLSGNTGERIACCVIETFVCQSTSLVNT
uniref:Superoxide dismutase 3, extracellular a n=1 Tax=Cyprinus carpio TaxID=7962 RepID=A0A8C2GGD5_CYPCA